MDATQVSGKWSGAGAAREFDDFVEACSTRLLRTAYLLTRDRGRAEDLLQTALVKAWLSWSRIDGDPAAYVSKILVNTYVTWWRRWSDEDHAVTHDLWTALGRLPRRQRAVIVLRYVEDLSEEETARLLGCSVSTVKRQRVKALAKLRLDDASVQEIQGEAAR
ncbi:SigE family RNA polymerase sigma factor [Nocardioides sp. NPDC057767]|uniref:SigE family RNA polymerase sigma factor n=1 Tax=unclassified Nocardioides TaxID=2615069 RepID=UPI00366B6FEE